MITFSLQKVIFFNETNSALVEELVVGYITDTTRAALEIGKPNKITLEDITYVIRKDKRKGKIQPRYHKNICFLNRGLISLGI